MSTLSNQEVFTGLEFDIWLAWEGLIAEEKYLVQKYLDPQLSTIEAGTNGGRMLFALQQLGFTNLSGFDYVPEVIAAAKAKDVEGTIDFRVGDAIDLAYPDNSFDQILYLQQMLCTIETDPDRHSAIAEAYRILKPGGTGLISMLGIEERQNKAIYRAYLAYLGALRKLTNNKLSLQYLPWLILGGKFNINAILDRGPYIYWYRLAEFCEELQSVGFKIVAVGSDRQINTDALRASDRDLPLSELEGRVYAVVTK